MYPISSPLYSRFLSVPPSIQQIASVILKVSAVAAAVFAFALSPMYAAITVASLSVISFLAMRSITPPAARPAPAPEPPAPPPSGAGTPPPAPSIPAAPPIPGAGAPPPAPPIPTAPPLPQGNGVAASSKPHQCVAPATGVKGRGSIASFQSGGSMASLASAAAEQAAARQKKKEAATAVPVSAATAPLAPTAEAAAAEDAAKFVTPPPSPRKLAPKSSGGSGYSIGDRATHSRTKRTRQSVGKHARALINGFGPSLHRKGEPEASGAGAQSPRRVLLPPDNDSDEE